MQKEGRCQSWAIESSRCCSNALPPFPLSVKCFLLSIVDGSSLFEERGLSDLAAFTLSVLVISHHTSLCLLLFVYADGERRRRDED